MTCPWFAASQENEDLKSTNNSVVIVYVNHNERVLGNVDSHTNENQMETGDQVNKLNNNQI